MTNDTAQEGQTPFEPEAITFDDLFAQVQAQEAMVLALSCTVDVIFQALACVIGEGKANDFRDAAAVVESWPTTSPGDVPHVISYREHGHEIAVGILRDMAAVIEAGTAVMCRTVPGPQTPQ